MSGLVENCQTKIVLFCLAQSSVSTTSENMRTPLCGLLVFANCLLMASAQTIEKSLRMPNGDFRTYLLTLPSNFDGRVSTDRPALFDFHGSGSNSLQQLLYTNLTGLADQDGVILVHPKSKDAAWHGTLYQPEDTEDVDFIYALVDLLCIEYGASSFYAIGMSSGGDITCTLACQPDSPFSGFGAVAYSYYWGEDPENGGFYNGNNMGTPPVSFITGMPTAENCAHGQGRPLMYFHGTADRLCPYAGSGSPWFDPPAEDLAKRWARHNKCTGDWIEEMLTSEVVRYTWTDCAAKTEFYKIVGGGHQWPGTFGATRDISASVTLWDFFGLRKKKRHVR